MIANLWLKKEENTNYSCTKLYNLPLKNINFTYNQGKTDLGIQLFNFNQIKGLKMDFHRFSLLPSNIPTPHALFYKNAEMKFSFFYWICLS